MEEKNRSFLGTGWNFPPAFGKGGKNVEMVSGEEDIKQSLGILLKTSIGERLMHPEFGCDLGSFMFEEIDQSLKNEIRGIVEDALLNHETRIDLNDINVYEDQALNGQLIIEVDYSVRTTNSRHNFVYPFYLNEAVQNRV